MKHPLELIQLAKEARYKEPRKIENDEYIISKNNINYQQQSLENLYQDIQKINEILKPLQIEYNREMNFRKELKETLNNDNKKTSLFKRKN